MARPNTKEYLISVKAHKDSLKRLETELNTALDGAMKRINEGEKFEGLSRSDKAKIKSDLMEMAGIEKHLSEIYKDMLSGVIPATQADMARMKKDIKDTMDFMSGAMQKMRSLGDATDWMKQGVGFVDQFVGMQQSIENVIQSVNGLEGSFKRLNKNFTGFKEALAVTDAEAYLKRFGNATKSQAENLAEAQKMIERVTQRGTNAMKDAVAKGRSGDFDYSGYSKEEIEEEYKYAIEAITAGNKKIAELQAKSGSVKELRKNKEYLSTIEEMAYALKSLDNLPDISGDRLGANLKISIDEAVNSVKAASNEIKKLVADLQGEGVELSIVLPDPNAAEFASRINEFIEKLDSQLKNHPVKLSMDIANPFKDTENKKLTKKRREMAERAKEEAKKNAEAAGFDLGADFLLPDDPKAAVENADAVVFARKLVDAFNQIYKAMKPSQQLLLTETKKWRKEMDEVLSLNEWAKETAKELKLHVKYEEDEAKARLAELLTSLQAYIDGKPDLYVGIDTDRIIDEIESALKEHVFNIDNIHAKNITADGVSGSPVGGGVPYRIPIQYIGGGNDNPPIGPTSVDPDGTPSQTPTLTSNTGAVNHNTDAIDESTQSNNALRDAINRLESEITHQSKASEEADNEYETAKNKNKDAEISIAAIDAEIDKLEKDPERQKQIAARNQYQKAKRDAEKMDPVDIASARFNAINKWIADGDDAKLNQYAQEAREYLEKSDVFSEQLLKLDSANPDLKALDTTEKMNGRISEIESKIQSIQSGVRLEWLEKELDGLSTDDKNKKKSNIINGFRKEIEQIRRKQKIMDDSASVDSVLKDGSIVDIIRKAIYVDSQKQAIEKEKQIASANLGLKGLRSIKNDVNIRKLKNDRRKLTGFDEEETAAKRTKTKKRAPLNVSKRRKEAIENIVDNDLNPVQLVYDSVEKFLKDSNKKISDAKATQVEYNKKLGQLDKNSPDYDKRKSEIDKKLKESQDAINSWTDRQNLMKSYGFLTQTKDGAFSVTSIKSLTSLLTNVSTLSDSLAGQKKLNLAPIKDLAYYIPIVQQTLGVMAQTNDEYVDEKSLEQQFLAVIAFGKFKEELNKLAKGKGDLKPEDLQSFIKFFENIEPMAESVQLAKKYLAMLDKSNADELTNDDAKTYQDKAQQMWNELGSDAKKLFVETLRNDENYKNITSHDQFDLPGEFSKLINSFDNNIFDPVKSNPQLSKLIGLLERASVLNQARKSANNAYDYAVSEKGRKNSRSDIWAGLTMAGTPSQPISVRIVDGNGQEKVYSLHGQGQVPEHSDRMFKINPKSLNRFYKIAGISDKIEDLVMKMFDPSTTTQMWNQIADEFFKSINLELALGKNAFTPKSAQKYLFQETAVGKSQSQAAEVRKKQLEEEIAQIEAGKYPQYVLDELSKLNTDDEKNAKVTEIVGSLKEKLAKLKTPTFTKEEVIEAILALIHDNEIDAAKANKEKIARRKAKRKSKRISDEELSGTYEARIDQEKNRIFAESRVPKSGEDQLSDLIQRIDIAKQYGLMDTSYLKQLAENYKTKLKTAQDITDAKHAGKATQADMDVAWNEWREARKNLVNTFFDTDGWYLATHMNDQVNRINNAAKRETERKKQEAAMADDATRAQYAEIESRKQAKMSAASDEAAGFVERFITAPKRDVELELKNKNKRILEEQKNFNARMNALYNEANDIESVREVQSRRDSDEEIVRLRQKKSALLKDEVAYTEEYRKAIAEAKKIEDKTKRSEAIRDVESRFTYDTKYSDVYREQVPQIDAEINSIYNKYKLEIQEKKQQWIEAEAKKLQKDFETLVNSLLGFSEDIIPDEFVGDIKSFTDSVRKSMTESMSFFNEFGNIGEIVTGGENGIDAKDIKAAAAKAKEKGASVALHNHPDGIKALTPQDIISATLLSNDYGVGVTGSIADNIITSVDFTDISKTAGVAIAERYKKLIAESDEAILFNLDNFELTADAVNTLSESAKAGLSYRLNELLRQAITEVVGSDAGIFKQINAADASQLANINMKANMMSGKRSVAAFNSYITESGETLSAPVTSIAGISNWIAQKKQKAEDDINATIAQAIAAVDISNVVPADQIQSIVVAITENVRQEITETLNKIKGKTDKQLLAEEYTTASQTHDAEVTKLLAKIAERDDTIARLKKEYGIEDDASTTSGAESHKPTVTNTPQRRHSDAESYGAGGSGYGQLIGGLTSGIVGAFNTSNLATESTLRGIYSLLNGGPPDGGWGDDTKSQDKIGFSDAASDVLNRNFAQSLKGLMDSAKALDHEIMTFVGDGKVLSSVFGDSGSVGHDDYVRGVTRETGKIDYGLHNHPSGVYLPSAGDLISALIASYDNDELNGKTIKGHGSYSPSGVALMNFDGISKDIIKGIIDSSLAAWDQQLAKDGLTYGKSSYDVEALDDRYDNISGQEIFDLKTRAIKQLNDILIANFAQAGYSGAYQSYTYDEIAKLANPEGNTAEMQQAAQQVAEKIVQAGAEAAVEASTKVETDKPVEVPVEPVAASIPNLDNIDAETTRSLAKYIGNIHESKDHGVALKNGLYKIADLGVMSDDYKFDASHSEKLAKAWSQLEVGMQGAIADKLDDAAKAYIAALQEKLNAIAQKNNLDYKEINAVVAERNKLNQNPYLKNTKLTQDNIDSAKSVLSSDSGLFEVYDMLTVDKKYLNNNELQALGNGYFKLLQTIKSDLFANLDEDVQSLLQDAANSARAALEKNQVEFIGEDELSGKSITDANEGLIFGRGKKVGKVMTEMTQPALIKTSTNKAGKEVKSTLQKAKGTLVTEQQIANAKQEQITANNTIQQQERNLANTAQDRANAEQAVTDAKNDGGNVPSGDGIIPPEVPDEPQSTKFGGLHTLAQEATLQRVAALLAEGIKTKSGKKSSGGGGGRKAKGPESPSAVDNAEQARARLEAEVAAKYPQFKTMGNTRETNKSYVVDIINPRYVSEIEAARAELNALAAAGKEDTQEWINKEAELTNLLQEQALISEKITLTLDKQTGEITTKTGFNNIAAGTKAAINELEKFEAMQDMLADAQAVKYGQNGVLVSDNQKVHAYLKAVQELNNFKTGIKAEELFDPSTQAELYNMSQYVVNLRKEVESLLRITGSGDWKLFGDEKSILDTSGMDGSDIKKKMIEMMTANDSLKASFGDIEPVTDSLGNTYWRLSYTIEKGKNEVQEMTARINPLTGALETQAGAVKHVATGWEKFVSGLKGKFSSIVQYLVSITSIHDIIYRFREGIQYVRDIDLALTELKKVTDETDAIYANFLQNMSKTGGVIGATVADLTTMAAEWARIGYTIEESGKLAESTAILMNVSEFDDATEASEALISTMQAFGYAADESQQVVDILNEVGNNYAISSDGIATALQDSASALMEGGNSLEQATALVAAANRVVNFVPRNYGNIAA